ncbi:MAG: hypothetical protein IJ587_01640 [Synergistaceae bacterium]|nr:hypothetical protein [Synergistaceae bacterium]
MSVKRRDIIRYFKKCGVLFEREGGNHSIFVNANGRRIPVGRHSTFTRLEANMLCREAGIPPIF